eukprot:TRINITY_DN1993_c0_g1_i1.p1 TRINITY_DN1993_c0_g1~~TRINITY_DN1993_c0_g1_i1.p1  ORF type:complete len:105 (+),score=8.21 TRINITY_DN1993_c0_g1_i1:749-1063(+)
MSLGNVPSSGDDSPAVEPTIAAKALLCSCIASSSVVIRSSSKRLRRRRRSTPLVQFSGPLPLLRFSHPRFTVPPHMIPMGRGFSPFCSVKRMRLPLSPSRSKDC